MNELSKNLMCVQIRSGVELWVEKDRAENLMKLLTGTDTKFIEFDGQVFNRADIVGVFNAGTMADHTRRKNGQWQCGIGNWHERNVKCECGDMVRDVCDKCFVSPCMCFDEIKSNIGAG